MKLRFGTALVVLLLMVGFMISCSGAANNTPYTTPTPGVYMGEDGEFTLLENGEITGFRWNLNAKEDRNNCPVNMNENIKVTGGLADLTFTNKNTGETSFSMIVTFTSAKTAHLTYQYDFCPSTATITFAEGGDIQVYKGEATFNLVP